MTTAQYVVQEFNNGHRCMFIYDNDDDVMLGRIYYLVVSVTAPCSYHPDNPDGIQFLVLYNDRSGGDYEGQVTYPNDRGCALYTALDPEVIDGEKQVGDPKENTGTRVTSCAQGFDAELRKHSDMRLIPQNREADYLTMLKNW